MEAAEDGFLVEVLLLMMAVVPVEPVGRCLDLTMMVMFD